MNDRFVMKRFVNLTGMFFATAAVVTLLCLTNGLLPDQMLCVWIVVLCYFPLFVFLLEHSRLDGQLSNNRQTDFRRTARGYAIAAAAAGICGFLPEFIKPMIFIPLILSSFASRQLAFIAGIFWDAVLCLILGFSAQELVLYCFMTIVGTLIAEAAEEETSEIWCEILLCCLCVMLPGTFYYMAYQEVQMGLFAAGGVIGAAAAAFLRIFYRRFSRLRDQEIAEVTADILDDSYPMVRELSAFSKQEYQHARRVSRLAERCAIRVGADPGVCAAAGFYYRIGILEGESLTENGIRIAQKHCFPENVIRILSEYNGEQALPSTIESAIVHMVDALVKKMEVFDHQAMSSEWNQDMVIYQTLNEFSASGIYDRSGLSMNMFLKIREYLVNEKTIL